MSKSWDAEEDDILYNHYKTLSAGGIISQNLLNNRTKSAIWARAAKLGLKVNAPSNTNKKTDKEYTKELKEKRPDIVNLELYNGSNIKIEHMCIICEHIWKVSPNHLLSMNTNCPNCSLINRRHTNEDVDIILKNKGIKRLSEYYGSFEDLEVSSDICGHKWTTKFSYLQQGSGCPICNKGFGFNKNKENMPEHAILYLLTITLAEERFLKYGVTCNNSINQRVRLLRYNIGKTNVVDISSNKKLHTSGIKALEIEAKIKSTFPRYKSKLIFSGHTELLDVSLLDSIVEFIDIEVNNEI